MYLHEEIVVQMARERLGEALAFAEQQRILRRVSPRTAHWMRGWTVVTELGRRVLRLLPAALRTGCESPYTSVKS